MNLKRIKLVLLLISAFLTNGCGMHYDVKGQVVDAITKQPVEGAVVSINWIRYKFTPPGLPMNKERYGTTEMVTDEKGHFSVPKYIFGEHYMGAYRKGYFCWSSEYIFNPNGKTNDDIFVDRRAHRIKHGMVIKLQPTKESEYSFIHSKFAQMVSRRLSGSSLFDKASYKVRKVYWDHYSNKKTNTKKTKREINE